MNDWLQSLEGIFDTVWGRLETGAATRTQLTFATISPDGWPEARTVVLRLADRAAGVVEVHTDINSAKAASLRATPRAALHLWDAGLNLQIRLQADVVILTDARIDDRWAATPDHSKQSYGVIPAPGTVIDGPTQYTKPATRAQFAVLHCAVRSIDAVSLADPHRRAAYVRPWSQGGEWPANWLAP